jgi:hypothetical protein
MWYLSEVLKCLLFLRILMTSTVSVIVPYMSRTQYVIWISGISIITSDCMYVLFISCIERSSCLANIFQWEIQAFHLIYILLLPLLRQSFRINRDVQKYWKMTASPVDFYIISFTLRLGIGHLSYSVGQICALIRACSEICFLSCDSPCHHSADSCSSAVAWMRIWTQDSA